jgi:hypothetical protein
MIKIEVTGNSIPEVADKLLAIGASLQKTAQPAFNWFDAEPEHDPATPNEHARDFIRKLSAQIGAEVAEDAPVNPTSASKSAPTADGPNSQPTTKEPSTTPAPAASAPEDEELEVVDLPIAPPADEIDLRALVLKVVETRGKPFMEGILSSFGVVKASHVEAARMHELVARCQEALGK